MGSNGIPPHIPKAILEVVCANQSKEIVLIRQHLIELRKYAELQEVKLSQMMQDNINLLNFLTAAIRELDRSQEQNNVIEQYVQQCVPETCIPIPIEGFNQTPSPHQVQSPHQTQNPQGPTVMQTSKSKNANNYNIDKSNLISPVGFLTANEGTCYNATNSPLPSPPMSPATNRDTTKFLPRQNSSLISSPLTVVRKELRNYRSPICAVPMDVSNISSIYYNNSSFVDDTPSTEDNSSTEENVLQPLQPQFTLNVDAVERYSNEDECAVPTVCATTSQKYKQIVEDISSLDLEGKSRIAEEHKSPNMERNGRTVDVSRSSRLETEQVIFDLEEISEIGQEDDEEEDESDIFQSTFAVSTLEDCWIDADLSSLIVDNMNHKSGFVLVKELREAKQTRSGNSSSNIVHYVALLTGEQRFSEGKTFRCNFYKKFGTSRSLKFGENDSGESFKVVETDIVSHLPTPDLVKYKSKTNKLVFKFNFSPYLMG